MVAKEPVVTYQFVRVWRTITCDGCSVTRGGGDHIMIINNDVRFCLKCTREAIGDYAAREPDSAHTRD